MAQRGIYEFDAKQLFADFTQNAYHGFQIKNREALQLLSDSKKYVIKPDQLFGKRGKHGLLGINLDKNNTIARFDSHYNKNVTIDRFQGILNNFLVEECIPHDTEYYISCSCTREYDEIYFCNAGGINIEEHRDLVRKIQVPVLDELDEDIIRSKFMLDNQIIIRFILDFFRFFRSYGFSYLEVNPFIIHNNAIICLDMVAKIDDCEQYKQTKHRNTIDLPVAFGSTIHDTELQIRSLDEKTGASLKCSILNPDGSIRLLLGGGGASVIVMDTLTNMGLSNEVGNYGELSGNPSLEYNIEYTKLLIKQMLESKSSKQKTLCIYGGISNFTLIDNQFKGIEKALEYYKDEFLAQNISILVRRGGVNDVEALEKFSDFCSKNNIKAAIYGGEAFLTDPLHSYTF